MDFARSLVCATIVVVLVALYAFKRHLDKNRCKEKGCDGRLHERFNSAWGRTEEGFVVCLKCNRVHDLNGKPKFSKSGSALFLGTKDQVLVRVNGRFFPLPDND